METGLERHSDQTRAALLVAFRDLLFRCGFERVSVRGIVGEAGLARSTFYEHFSNKEDILRASMAHFLKVIAHCVYNDFQPPELVRILEHLWENRRLTDAIFSGSSRVILAGALSEMVEVSLRELHRGEPLILPYRLAAIHVAEGQLTLVENWLRGRAFCRADHLAAALHKSSRASACAMIAER